MFAVNPRKEMVPELDMLIEHLSSSGLLRSDLYMCVSCRLRLSVSSIHECSSCVQGFPLHVCQFVYISVVL